MSGLSFSPIKRRKKKKASTSGAGAFFLNHWNPAHNDY
jgi:hypothetical protein